MSNARNNLARQFSGTNTFTGSVVVPTQVSTDSSTLAATTAFVASAITAVGSGTRKTNLNVATAGQTVFTVPGGYAATLIDVRMNGYSLPTTDYVATNGTSITLNTAAIAGDEVETVVFATQNFASGSTLTPQTTIATDQQTTFTITGGYVAGLIEVYQNGLRLIPADFTATNGTSVVLVTPVNAGTEMLFMVLSGASFTSSVAKTGDTMTGPLVVNSNITTTGTFTSPATGDGSASIAGRNRFINGSMLTSQRYGTTNTALTANSKTYSVDRWLVAVNGASSSFLQVPSVSGVDGTAQAWAVAINSGAGVTNPQLFQRIEAVNSQDLAGKNVCATVWVFQSTGSAMAFGSAVYRPNTAEVFTSTTLDTVLTPIGSTTVPSGLWTKIAFTGQISTAATGGIEVAFTGSGSLATGTCYFTYAQFEAGTVPTPFERRSFGQELALCKRYYQKSYALTDNIGTTGNQNAIGVVSVSASYGETLGTNFEVELRTVPSVVIYSTNNGAAGFLYNFTSSTNVALTTISANTKRIMFLGGVTGYAASNLYYYQYTASAEL
jgi:hypothetical protein